MAAGRFVKFAGRRVDTSKEAVGLRPFGRAACSGTGVTASSGLFLCAGGDFTTKGAKGTKKRIVGGVVAPHVHAGLLRRFFFQQRGLYPVQPCLRVDVPLGAVFGAGFAAGVGF